MFQKMTQALVLALSLSSISAEADVRFDRKKLLGFTGTFGQEVRIELPKQLDVLGQPPYKFGGQVAPLPNPPKPLPSFLKIEGDFLVGTPNEAKEFDFVLSVIDSDPSGEKRDTNVPAKLVVAPPPPAFKITSLDLGVQPEGKLYEYNDIPTKVVHPQFVKSYSQTGIPKWLNLDSKTGKLSGTPKREDIGTTNFKIHANNDEGIATLDVKITVVMVLQHPSWKSNPIDLGDTNEGEKFEREASQYVINPEPLDLTYTIVDMSPPPWLSIGEKSGTLFGTPTVPKKYEIAVALKYKIDGQEYTKATTFLVNVKHVNHAPYWVDKPIKLPNPAFTGVQTTADLKNSAKDPDVGDTLTFSLSGPAWGKIDATTGKFSGTPGKSDVGENKFQITVKDQDGLSDTTDLIVQVVKSNEPPVWVNHPTVLPTFKEDQLVQINLNDPKFVMDPDNDQPLYFQAMGNLPTWLTLSEAGILHGTPGKFNVGAASFSVKVSDKKSTPDDITEIKIFVEHVNHAPYWVLDPIQGKAKEDSPWTLDVSGYAKDDDLNDTLTFSAISGPAWAQLSSKGVFTGTPKMPEVGTHTWVVQVQDTAGAKANVKVVVTVEHVNHPPVWKQPAELANAKEDQPYTASIKDLVTDPDPGDQVRFAKVSQKPEWLKINGDGSVSGTPGAADVGTYFFEVRALDLANASAVGTIKITVESTNHAPYWRNAPAALVMTEAHEDKTYKFSLKDYAADPDNDPLTFSLVSGPAWMFVGTAGDVSGVPTAADVGNQKARLKVADPKGLFAETDATIVVIHTNHEPQILAIPLFEIKERENKSWDLKPYLKDLDNDPLTCTKKTAGEDWAQLSRDCVITANPKRPQVKADPWIFDFQVADKETFTTGKFQIKVLKDPVPPYWLSEPITFEPLIAESNIPFSNNISGRAKDPNNEPMTFKKEGGPAWLVVNTDGSLGGMPKDADLGMNDFKLVVCNADKCSDQGTLKILVKPGMQKDEWQIDAKVAGASSEYIWDIDNSDHCDKTMRALKQNIGVFYDKLKAAELHHYGIMISSDVKEFGAEPIRNKKTGDPMLLRWDANNLVSAWKERVDLAYSSGMCNNCNSSPIWGIYKFFERLPNDFGEIYKKDFFMSSVPLDGMMVSHQMDHYKYYTKNLPALKNYTPNDFARDFIQTNRKEEKSFRVSAIAPECPTLLETSGDPNSTGPANSYSVIVNKTGGKYYTTKCDFNAVQVLKEWADSLIFRAYVHAKQRVKLTKVPALVNSIKVTIGGTVVPGNTGSSGDKWSYDSTANEVVLKWYLIDEGQLKPGQKIEIEYRVH